MVFVWIGLFVISLAVLIKASDYFTDSAEKIGLAFKIPPFIIGVTIVALGTSLPELVSSLFAVWQGSSEIVAGNVIGSNIANIFLVLGVSAIIAKKLTIAYELIHVDLPLLAGSTFLVAVMLWDGVFTWHEGVLCIVGLLIYLHYTVKSEQSGKDKEIEKEMADLQPHKEHKLKANTIAVLVLSAVFIFLGAKYTIDSVIQISEILNIGKEVIAVSAIALGTSLPELIVSISAARKGKPEIAVGNVLGSNIFNAFAVMGIPSFLGSLTVSDSILSFGLPIMIIATLMYYFITQDKEITRWEGSMLLLFYVLFISKLFGAF